MLNILNITGGDLLLYSKDFQGKIIYADIKAIAMDPQYKATMITPFISKEHIDHDIWDYEDELYSHAFGYVVSIQNYIRENKLDDVNSVLIDIEPQWVKYFIKAINDAKDVSTIIFDLYLPIWNEHRSVVSKMIRLNN